MGSADIVDDVVVEGHELHHINFVKEYCMQIMEDFFQQGV